MKGKEFTEPLIEAAIALRGQFDKGFIDLLYRKYGSDEPEVWKEACRLVSLLPKTARFVVLRDFDNKVLEGRDRREEHLKRERRRNGGAPLAKMVSMRTLCNLAIQYGPWWMKQDAAKRLEQIEKEEKKLPRVEASE